MQPRPGDEAAVVAALATAVEGGDGAAGRALLSAEMQAAFDKAVAVLKEASVGFSAICALPHFGASAAGAIVGSLANVAIAVSGDDAPNALFVLPPEANGWGARDMGACADLLPGQRPISDASRRELQRLWGAQVATGPGLTFDEMTNGSPVKALVVLNDNPLMLAPDRARVEKLLSSVELLAVIDSLPTDTAGMAHAVLPDAGYWAKEGTTTSADRRIMRLQQAHDLRGEAQQGWRILSELGKRLAERLGTGEIRMTYPDVGEITDEIAQAVPLHAGATWRELDSGTQQHLNPDGHGGAGPTSANRVVVQAGPTSRPTDPSHNGGFTLATGRGLYTSYEGAAVHSPEADKLHRDDSVKMHPDDASALGVAAGDEVMLRNGEAELRAPVAVTAAVQPKMLYLPLYYNGGAVGALFGADAPVAAVEVSRA